MKPLEGFPAKRGLYDPALEKDSCGVGFIAHVKGIASHQNVLDADQILQAMDHRGAMFAKPTPATVQACSPPCPTSSWPRYQGRSQN